MVDLERPAATTTPPAHDDPEDCVITLFAGGDALGDAPLLWRDTTPERLIRDHEQALRTPALEVFGIKDAMLHGPGWVSKDDRVLFEKTIYPAYCQEWYRSKRIYNAVDVDLARLAERRFRTGWHISHFNCGVYGHWLTEVMPKLLAIREFGRRWPDLIDIPVFMPSNLPAFVHAHTRSLLPQVPVVTYDPQQEFIRVERVLMPTWGSDHVYNPWLALQLASLSPDRNPDLPKRIFVSRRLESVFRSLDNLEELEQIATEAGLTVVYPEDHAFETQIAMFQNANTVVGEYGGGLHNAMFSAPGTIVIALNWINRIQSRMARLRGHRIGYLLPTSGTEVGSTPDTPLQHYEIDPTRFRATVREVVALHPCAA